MDKISYIGGNFILISKWVDFVMASSGSAAV